MHWPIMLSNCRDDQTELCLFRCLLRSFRVALVMLSSLGININIEDGGVCFRFCDDYSVAWICCGMCDVRSAL